MRFFSFFFEKRVNENLRGLGIGGVFFFFCENSNVLLVAVKNSFVMKLFWRIAFL